MRRNPQYRPPRGRRQGVRYPEAMLPLAGYRTPCRTWDARTPLRIFPPASRMSSLQLVQGYCGTHKDSDSPVPSSRSCLSTYGKWYDATEPSLLACALRCVACGKCRFVSFSADTVDCSLCAPHASRELHTRTQHRPPLPLRRQGLRRCACAAGLRLPHSRHAQPQRGDAARPKSW